MICSLFIYFLNNIPDGCLSYENFSTCYNITWYMSRVLFRFGGGGCLGDGGFCFGWGVGGANALEGVGNVEWNQVNPFFSF